MLEFRVLKKLGASVMTRTYRCTLLMGAPYFNWYTISQNRILIIKAPMFAWCLSTHQQDHAMLCGKAVVQCLVAVAGGGPCSSSHIYVA